MGERLAECWSTSVRYISGGESSDAVHGTAKDSVDH